MDIKELSGRAVVYDKIASVLASMPNGKDLMKSGLHTMLRTLLGDFPKDPAITYFDGSDLMREYVDAADAVEVGLEVIGTAIRKEKGQTQYHLLTDQPYGVGGSVSERFVARLTNFPGMYKGRVSLVFGVLWGVRVFVAGVEVQPTMGADYFGVNLPVECAGAVTLVAGRSASLAFHARHYQEPVDSLMFGHAGLFTATLRNNPSLTIVFPARLNLPHRFESRCTHVLNAQFERGVRALGLLLQRGVFQIMSTVVCVVDNPVVVVLLPSCINTVAFDPLVSQMLHYKLVGDEWTVLEEVKMVRWVNSRL